MIGELASFAEVRGEQALHQRVLPLGAAGRLGEPVGVEGVAESDPVEVEGEAHLRPSAVSCA